MLFYGGKKFIHLSFSYNTVLNITFNTRMLSQIFTHLYFKSIWVENIPATIYQLFNSDKFKICP